MQQNMKDNDEAHAMHLNEASHQIELLEARVQRLETDARNSAARYARERTDAEKAREEAATATTNLVAAARSARRDAFRILTLERRVTSLAVDAVPRVTHEAALAV